MEQQFDRKAAKEIFGVKEYSRGEKVDTLTASKDATNPIDIALRQLSLMPNYETNIVELFMDKWVAAVRHDKQGIVVGRIKDVYADRSLKLKIRNGEVAIVPFENVLELKESEI